MLMDGTIFKGQHLIVAIGIDRLGNKIVLGLRQGAGENAAVVQDLLGELAERGVDFNDPRLYCWTAAKRCGPRRSPTRATRRSFSAVRCTRSAMWWSIFPEAIAPRGEFRMRAAYAMAEAADGKGSTKLHDELMEANPSAAASLLEGLEDCLTVWNCGSRRD